MFGVDWGLSETGEEGGKVGVFLGGRGAEGREKHLTTGSAVCHSNPCTQSPVLDLGVLQSAGLHASWQGVFSERARTAHLIAHPEQISGLRSRNNLEWQPSEAQGSISPQVGTHSCRVRPGLCRSPCSDGR